MKPARLFAAALTLAVVAGSGLTGCKKSRAGDDFDGVTLRFWAMPNTARPKDDLRAILAPFEARNPGIRVQVEILDWSTALSKIGAAAQSGAGPDVLQLGTSWAATVADSGALLPLDGMLPQLGGQDAFVPAMHGYMRPIYADSIICLPWFVDVRPFFYRTDVLAQAGVDIGAMSGSWDGFRAGLRKIRDARLVIDGQKVEPMGLAGKNDWNVVHNIYPWIVSDGGDIVSPLGDSVLLDDERSVQGVLHFLDLIREGLAPRAYLDKNTAQVSREFDDGRIAFWQETTSKLVYLQSPQGMGGAPSGAATRNFSTALPPAGPAGRKLFIGGSALAIFRSTEHPEEARKLLAYLATDTGAVLEFCRRSGMAPALGRVFDLPFFSADPNRRLYKDLVAAGKPYPAVPYWGELETDILNTRFGNIFDLASEANGPYSEAAVRKELKEAADAARTLIRRRISENPGYAARLSALKASSAR